MIADDLHAALKDLFAIDGEVDRCRDTYAKAEHVAHLGPTKPHWELDSPPGCLPVGDRMRLAQLSHTTEVAIRCREATAKARGLLARLLIEETAKHLEDTP